MDTAAKGISKNQAETLQMLTALEEAAERIGVKVRYENIAGGPVRTTSGSCRIREQEVVLIDRRLAPADKLHALVRELRRYNLEQVFIPPAARRLLREDSAELRGEEE